MQVQELVEEKKIPLKSAPYQRRRMDDEEREDQEILEFEKGNQEPPVEAKKEEEAPAPDASAEEKTFAKRYADLRRFHDQKVRDFQTSIDSLKEELSKSVTKANELPKTEEEIKAWREQHPEVYNIVRTIAALEAKDKETLINKKLEEIEKRELVNSQESAKNKLLELHPDMEKLRNSEDFHEWAAEQSKEIQDWLYNNPDDFRKASRAIDLYKLDRGLAKDAKKEEQKKASENVTKKSTPEPKASEAKTYKRSWIEKLRPKQFEEIEDELMAAMMEGRIIED